jgi:biopolymer transport protein TolR
MGGPGEDLNSEINVTPFVDVMLVLLVIFMVTAPMLTTGVDIDLPETEAPVVEDTEGKLVLSINKERQLFLGNTQVKWADLQVKLSTNQRVKLEKTLWIEADQSLPYRVVVTAMAQARAAGVSKLMMLTDANAEMDVSALDKMASGAPSPPPEE